MSWKTAYRSFYYANADEPDDIHLDPASTAVIVIDIQNTYLEDKDTPEETEAWQPFYRRMRETVIPNTKHLIDECRAREVPIIFARIGSLTRSGRDRSLSQKKPGFNYLHLPKNEQAGQIVPELVPDDDDIIMLKSTDSVLTGTNLRIILRNMEIKDVIVAGIFTDQCISSSVRSLADESFGVVVVEDCCAAATDELHDAELKIINMIYCHVVQLHEALSFFAAK